jgi:hypothetical protein
VIVGSLLLILGAIALLALGLVNGSNAYLVGSIAASLLAAIALVVGSRQAAAAREANEEPARGRGDGERGEGRIAAERGGHRHGRREQMTEVIPAVRAEVDERAESDELAMRRSMVAVQEPAIPAQGGTALMDRGPGTQLVLDDDPDDFDEEEPPDEPVAQQVSPADAARVARMSNEVLVIDGRPRYHLGGCVHLLGRDSEPLPVHEAVELGFTPCGRCEPDSALLAEARRV